MASYVHRSNGFVSSFDKSNSCAKFAVRNTMDHEEKRSCCIYRRSVNLEGLDSRIYGLSLEQFMINHRTKKSTCQSTNEKSTENVCSAVFTNRFVLKYRRMVDIMDRIGIFYVSYLLYRHNILRLWCQQVHVIHLVMLHHTSSTNKIISVQSLDNHFAFCDEKRIYCDSKDFRCVFSDLEKIDSVFSQWKYYSGQKKFHSVLSEPKTLDSVSSQCQCMKKISRNLIGKILNGCRGTVYVNRYLVIYQHRIDIQSEVNDPYIQFGGRRKASTCDDTVWLVESIGDVEWIVMRDFWTVCISMGYHFWNDATQAVSEVNEFEVGNQSGRDFVNSFIQCFLF